MADRYEDDRGIIQDLIAGPLDAVTEIFTRAGSVRGNHIHNHTYQWTYVVSGRLLVATEEKLSYDAGTIQGVLHSEDEFGPRQMTCDRPGIAHAWKALEDTVVLVFTRGPRSGASYESDVVRLAEPNWLLR